MATKSQELDLGRSIVAWRHRRGLSQGTIARRAGLDQSYLSRLESGKIQPNLRTAQKIGAALRISLPELLGPSPPERIGRPCPVSRSGKCLMDLVDSDRRFDQGKGPERYSSRQLRLIRRFTHLVETSEGKMTAALEILIARMLAEGNGGWGRNRGKLKARGRAT